MNIILYTTHCPKCKVLESKLIEKNIDFQIEEDIEKLIDLGYMSAPILSVDGEVMEFGEAVKWVNNI